MPIQQMFLGTSSASAGGWSVSFDGNGDYLEVAKSTDFDFGTGAFTMEAWVYANSLTTDSSVYDALDSIFESIDWNSQDGQYSFGISHENKPYFYIFDQNNTFYYGTTVLSTQQWYHLAVSRDGSGNIRLFVNGALESTNSNSYSLSNSNQPNPARIGGCKIHNSNSGVIEKSFDGYITNLRVLKGTALYTSNFTAPEDALEDITNTVLLCCNGESATDATVSPAAITVQGDTTHDTDNPFSTSSDGSISIDGDDSLIVPLDTIGTNDFTFECWFKAQTSGSPGTHDTLFALSNYGEGGNDSGPGNSFSFYAHNNGGLKIFTRSGGGFSLRYEEAGLYSLNTWTHFAWTRNGSSNRVFINGTETGDWTGQTDYSSGQNLYIGCNDYSRNGVPNEYGLNGNISNARVIIGQALYTSNFTPSTTALTTTSQGATASNVKVLCCNSRTDATAATLPLAITAKGDATSSTEVPFPFTAPASNTYDIRVWCDGVTAWHYRAIDINGTNVWDGNTDPGVQYQTFTGYTAFTSIRVTRVGAGGKARLSKVAVQKNGGGYKDLIDGVDTGFGTVTWSSTGTATNGFADPAADAFDGDDTDTSSPNDTSVGNYVDYTFTQFS